MAGRAAGGAGVADRDRPGRRRPRRLLLDEGAGRLAVAAGLWETIALEAARESRLWAAALRREDERELDPVFSPLGEERYALGIETIYEGYLLHYGQPRLFAPPTRTRRSCSGTTSTLTGSCGSPTQGTVEAVADLAALISICAQLRADGLPGDGEVWAATAATLGGGEEARLRWDGHGSEPAERALAGHERRVG
jgi:hypothetical protein